MIADMNADAIIFAMANPVPEIMPDEAKAAGARIVGTGRSDFPKAIAGMVSEDELNENNILPKPFDKRVGQAVSEAVFKAAKSEGVCRC